MPKGGNVKQIDKTKFVAELGQNVLEDIYVAIRTGKIPEDWDGIELRQYMADCFERTVFKGTLKGSRKRKYNNDVLVNNL